MQLSLTLTPNRDPGPRPFISLVSYERTGDRVTAVYREWELWPRGDGHEWALVTYSELPMNARHPAMRREHAGPTVRTTSRLQLIADGLLKPCDLKRWRKSAKNVAAQAVA
jgi:hypothetical protein